MISNFEAPGAYRWWYVDALSDDRRTALVVILFGGSVFSPFYAARLRAGEDALPREHCAVHAALYRDGRRVFWSFGDRPAELHERGWDASVSRSTLVRSAGRIRVTLDERWPLPLRGTVELMPEQVPGSVEPLLLAPGVADHRWHPRVPLARARVHLTSPALRLEGTGYHDWNGGTEPLERALAGWVWSREEGEPARIQYDVLTRSGERFRHALGAEAGVERGGPRTLWRVELPASLGRSRPAQVIDSAPFYARYTVEEAGRVTGLGETLDLARFDSAVVRWMLRWKTARRSS